MAMTTYDIARCFAGQFTTDRNIAAWAQEAFGKPFTVQIGADMRELPTEQDAPYIVILTGGFASGLQKAEVDHVLRVIPGIADGATESVNGVLEYRGLRRLAKELSPMLDSAMRAALPRAKLQEIETEFVLLEFPLLEAFIDVSVTDPQPIGRRY